MTPAMQNNYMVSDVSNLLDFMAVKDPERKPYS